MKLTKEQREECIKKIIEWDMDGFYKDRDIYEAFYYGIKPYKDMTNKEIIERYEETEMELPIIERSK